MKQLHDIMVLIGRKRLVILLVVLAIAAILGGVWQKVMLPRSEAGANEKSAIDSERSRLQRELEALPIKYQELLDNERKYEELLKSSFVSTQDRIAARARIDAVRVAAGLRGISYTIAPVENAKHPEQDGVDGTLSLSRIKVEMRGLSDIEMRDFIHSMRRDFGGLVTLRAIEFKREKPLTQDNLEQLKNGKPVDFILGKADFDWYTIIPNPVEEQGEETQW